MWSSWFGSSPSVARKAIPSGSPFASLRVGALFRGTGAFNSLSGFNRSPRPRGHKDRRRKTMENKFEVAPVLPIQSPKELRRLRPVAVDEKNESAQTQLHRKIVSFLRTDGGAARTFAHVFGDQVRFDHSRKRWLVWDEHRWEPDEVGNVNRLALFVAKLVRTAAFNDAVLSDEKERKAWFGWGVDLDKRPRHEAMIAMARNLEPIADSGKNWDAAPGLLGVSNGVVNLRTGELRDG